MSDASYRRHREQVSLEHTARRLSTRLSPELLQSIEAISPLLIKKRIPADHLAELERLKLAERRFGAPRLTPLGRCVLLI